MWNALKHLNVSQRWMLKSNISHDFDGWNPGVPPTCKPCVANHVHKFHVKPMASPSRFPKCWISKRKSTRQILATNDMPIDSQLIPTHVISVISHDLLVSSRNSPGTSGTPTQQVWSLFNVSTTDRRISGAEDPRALKDPNKELLRSFLWGVFYSAKMQLWPWL